MNSSNMEHTNRFGRVKFVFRSGLRMSFGHLDEEIHPFKVLKRGAIFMFSFNKKFKNGTVLTL